ncbi:hypothetical protein TV39_04720 [Arthrobacter sp. SPG23]|uniref:hypothetical protein n=1 Tax=Arthrobacter sp. SPG23 TaxID=1610703 RepID=UPI0005B89A5B|nr:hypothetical protein [Arthrobacter sp. SPG23]KIS28684.1 hypothetical protein TV39_04720 [Arthrobacter sp. SPG23]
MARKRLDVEVPDGQHLGFSRDTDGAYRAHLFDNETNGLVGHAELFEPAKDESDSPYIEYVYVSDSRPKEGRELADKELDEALEALVRLGIIVAAAAAPHVKRWWQGRAIPGLKSAGNTALLAVKSTSDNTLLTVKSTWNRFTGTRKPERSDAPVEMVPAAEPVREDSSTELEVAFKDYRARMSSEEARQRFVVALLARAFSEEQMRMLRNAEIEDDGDPLSLKAAMVALTPQQVGETITSMLEKNPSLLERESLAGLGMILGGRRADGECVPLRIERSKEVGPLRRGQS